MLNDYVKECLNAIFLIFSLYLCSVETIKRLEFRYMDKSSNVRVVGFPKNSYDKEWLDSINDSERSEAACADGDTQIWGNLTEFQDDLHLDGAGRNIIDLNWIYFLND